MCVKKPSKIIFFFFFFLLFFFPKQKGSFISLWEIRLGHSCAFYHFHLKTPILNLIDSRPNFRFILNLRPPTIFLSIDNKNRCKNIIMPL